GRRRFQLAQGEIDQRRAGAAARFARDAGVAVMIAAIGEELDVEYRPMRGGVDRLHLDPDVVEELACLPRAGRQVVDVFAEVLQQDLHRPPRLMARWTR